MVTKSLVEVPFLVHGLIFIESVRGPLVKITLDQNVIHLWGQMSHKGQPEVNISVNMKMS